jgi:hypothetical protein
MKLGLHNKILVKRANSRNEIDFEHNKWDLVEMWQDIETR